MVGDVGGGIVIVFIVELIELLSGEIVIVEVASLSLLVSEDIKVTIEVVDLVNEDAEWAVEVGNTPFADVSTPLEYGTLVLFAAVDRYTYRSDSGQ